LRIAEQNWQQQREPADVRVYWRAAHATHGTAGEPTETRLRQWLAITNYEDATLAEVRR